MPDNWDHAIADARGSYVGILTDRSVFRRDAMEVVHAEIESTGAELVHWYNDLYGRGPAGSEFKRRACTFKRYRHSGEEILDYFVHGSPKYSTKVIPKLMTSVCRRSILEAIRDSEVGRVCPPIAPDFTSGFLMLGHADFTLTIDESLYVSVGTGNGAEFRRGGELAERFRSDLGLEWRDFVDRMPSEACFAHALVLNDLMRVRDAVPRLFDGIEIDRPQYYLGCLNDYRKATNHGARRDADLAALLTALDHEPPEIQASVKETKLYRSVTRPERAREKAATKVAALKPDPHPRFETVFDAMAWDAAHPREPVPAGLWDLMPDLDEMKKTKRRRGQTPPDRPDRAAEPIAERTRAFDRAPVAGGSSPAWANDAPPGADSDWPPADDLRLRAAAGGRPSRLAHQSRLQTDQREEGHRPRQLLERQPRVAGLELRERVRRPGRHRDRPRPDDLAAGDVVGRVADHVRPFGFEEVTGELPRGPRDRGAVRALHAERSARVVEELPQPVMAELGLRPLADVAGQQQVDHVVARRAPPGSPARWGAPGPAAVRAPPGEAARVRAGTRRRALPSRSCDRSRRRSPRP